MYLCRLTESLLYEIIIRDQLRWFKCPTACGLSQLGVNLWNLVPIDGTVHVNDTLVSLVCYACGLSAAGLLFLSIKPTEVVQRYKIQGSIKADAQRMLLKEASIG